MLGSVNQGFVVVEDPVKSNIGRRTLVKNAYAVSNSNRGSSHNVSRLDRSANSPTGISNFSIS